MDRLYPAAMQMPASPTNYRKAGRAGFDLVVVHATDGHGIAQNTASMWQERGHGSSAHFCVGQDGTIVQAVGIDDIAWHAHQRNPRSVGVEHSARSPGELGATDPGLPPTEAQLQASARLCAWLCRQGGFEPSRVTIKGHAECDPDTTHADCPTGAGIDLDAFVARVQAAYAAPFA